MMKRLSVALGLGLGIGATTFAHAVLVEVTPPLNASVIGPTSPFVCGSTLD
jgi:tartrate dehydratase alpha subunit/fumarate hydratase class I-like protein